MKTHGNSTYYVHNSATNRFETLENGDHRLIDTLRPIQAADADFGTPRTVTRTISDTPSYVLFQTDLNTLDYYNPSTADERRNWLIGIPKSVESTSQKVPYRYLAERRVDFDVHNKDNLRFSNGSIEKVYVEKLSGDPDTYLSDAVLLRFARTDHVDHELRPRRHDPRAVHRHSIRPARRHLPALNQRRIPKRTSARDWVRGSPGIGRDRRDCGRQRGIDVAAI